MPQVLGEELYDHSRAEEASTLEAVNVVETPRYTGMRDEMRKLLLRGPLTGGGWGPWH